MAFKRKILDGLSGLLQQLQSSMLPSGAIVWFGNRTTAPSGWAICNGKTVTMSDGTSFVTPNLIGRYPLGATSNIGTTVEAGLPNITGGAMHQENSQQAYGAFFNRTGGSGSGLGAYDWRGGYNRGFGFDASRSSAIYGRSTTVTPPSVKLLPCMKL